MKIPKGNLRALPSKQTSKAFSSEVLLVLVRKYAKTNASFQISQKENVFR